MRLRREQVVATALRLLNDVGLDALTMRRLGQELDVQAATLYWHIKNKEELLDAMAEAMLAGCAESVPVALSGMERAAGMAERLRGALLAHRDGARVFAGTYVAQDNTLRVSEVLLGALSDAGLLPARRRVGVLVDRVLRDRLHPRGAGPGGPPGSGPRQGRSSALPRGGGARSLPAPRGGAPAPPEHRHGRAVPVWTGATLKGLEAELEGAPRPRESRSSHAGAKKRAPRRSG